MWKVYKTEKIELAKLEFVENQEEKPYVSLND